MAKTNFWVCSTCGFVNTPHAFRRGEANNKCEQDGTKRDGGLDADGALVVNEDISASDAVIAKRAG